MCRKYGNKNHIFEFLENVVGINKSLNDMMKDIVSYQTQIQLVKSEQEWLCNDLEEQKQAIEYHEVNFGKVFKEVESAGIDEIR